MSLAGTLQGLTPETMQCLQHRGLNAVDAFQQTHKEKKTMNLLLHCGAHLVDADVLESVYAPETQKWKHFRKCNKKAGNYS